MSDDKLSFLDNKPQQPEPAQKPEPQPEAKEAAPVAKEPADEPAKEPAKEGEQKAEPDAQNAPKQAEPQSADPSKPGYVPLDALLSEREKRKDLERRLQEIDQREKQAKAKAPDPIDDPEGYARYQSETIDNTRAEIKLETSEELMREKLGDAEFDKMAQWWRQQVQENPHLIQQGIKQRNPWKFAYDQYRKNSVLSEVGTDLEAYRKKIVEEERAKWEAEQAERAAQTPGAQQPARQPPPSLASKPQAANAKSIPTGPGQAFDNVFTR